MMTMTDQDKRIEIVAKLLAKAEGASTEEEAATFFEAASERMQRWAIDDAVLAARNVGDRDKVIAKRITVPTTYKQPDSTLLHGIATVHDVKVIRIVGARAKGESLDLVGFSRDVANVELLFTSMLLQSTRFMRAETIPPDVSTSMDRFVWRRSFRMGFANRVVARLVERKRRTVHEATETHGSGMELVLADKRSEVERFYDELHPDARPGRATSVRADADGAVRGRAAGDRADLGGRAVGANRKELR